VPEETRPNAGNESELDPIVSQSLSFPYLISALLLMASLGWALYDEYYGTRPWKDYQHRFVAIYSSWLKKKLPIQDKAEKAVKESETYKQLDAALQAADKAAGPEFDRVNKDLALLATRKTVIDDWFQAERGWVGARTYDMETAGSPSSHDSIAKEIQERKDKVTKKSVPLEKGGGEEELSLNYEQLEKEYNRLKDRKNELLSEQAGILRPVSELRKKRDEYMSDQLVGLTRQQMQGLIDKMDKFDYDIKQINVPEGNLVDRCESCHVGTREPVVLTRHDVAPKYLGGVEGGSQAFTTHPNLELLKIHDPERFGCSPCHGGNGRATTSVEKAHGKNEHWLFPMYAPPNREAGCNQCHSADLVVRLAPVLNSGKELFRWKGCMGCHRMEGFDAEPERLFTINQTIKQLETDKADAFRNAGRMEKQADTMSGDAAARMNQTAQNMRVSMSRVDSRIEELDTDAKNLLQEIKKVGPSLKEVKMKLRKEWIPAWIKNPQAFRPGAKMPTFRLQDDEIQAISAFIWQSGVTGPLDTATGGDPTRGKDLFETRGCMACHSMGEDAEKVGGYFAANLTREGEKINYNYLVRWIHNPRQRTLPYSPTAHRDITPADYQKKGLPFSFDLDHTKSPVDGHEMQVEQQTIMPNLRLNMQEVRDIASYLMTKKKADPDKAFPPAPYMDDPKLKAKGMTLVRNYGCAGCHEIAGMEDESRIGTELTNEGSKPVERLDFALLGREAEDGVEVLGPNAGKETEPWYDHKGFFEHKLAQPEIFDRGKSKPHLEQLKMPNFNLEKKEIRAISTFLQGAVDPTMPPSFFYKPADQRHDIQEGWWIIKKYNCQGCHVVEIGQRSILMDLPKYQDPDWKEQLPPQITSEGARVSPDWLVHFLKNPSLAQGTGEAENDKDGVRSYLKVRMPTFYLSDNEVRKLVRFFAAVSYQPQPYIQTKLEPLTPAEQAMARALFTSKEAPCLKCHATGVAAHDAKATAPNFLLAKERLKPGWTGRWLLNPALISPGTSMPSGLFKRDGDRWVFNGQTPPSFNGYTGDHAQLLVRYMFQLSADEQKRLVGAGGGGAGGTR
jgi:cytochrome c551/c552